MSFVKQACDCCRVRRIKCDGKGPCSRCLQHDLKCTYLKQLKKRGPKSIRARSLKKIADVQKASNGGTTIATAEESTKVPKRLIDQCLRLYHNNLYVIWPLLCYEDLHRLLEERYDDCYVYWFLVALSAATLSDLQTEIESKEGASLTGKQLCDLCMSLHHRFDDLRGSDVFRIMTYYCLHRCFAQSSDTRTSYRLSCEAISLIKIAGFHREETYERISFNEQQLRRKVYYLVESYSKIQRLLIIVSISFAAFNAVLCFFLRGFTVNKKQSFSTEEREKEKLKITQQSWLRRVIGY
ncbi:hypothetical protein SEUBUCD646_0E02770 [Saccharomyces eubayanus]|uniref:Zn(2)-C6 fungal-type domain-containing protein n=1 Tax=Saccharomyces eubayanus TaxID=1080349 RepID=A0ABN8VNU4_SACEU|nr:hypothetical protein SEUBUCD650_0M00110 [Saccharomyces eubayanus]CAI1965885.1 hypothetical protein SEUBUCD650_0E02790 [Saccharomyces eubayanus]CAI1995206.1 hypothetical protein SEUBUCD646_0E02770 [Saccharomyces eubayanus]